ncbi:MAG: hypothetical protein QNL04_04480 [SAR324 cluster bacterium]|nr:hypothetical protein [SAR324 cluster bacterium]
MNEPLIESLNSNIIRLARAMESFNDSLPVLKSKLEKVEALQALKLEEKERKANIGECVAKAMPDVMEALKELEEGKKTTGRGTNSPAAKP